MAICKLLSSVPVVSPVTPEMERTDLFLSLLARFRGATDRSFASQLRRQIVVAELLFEMGKVGEAQDLLRVAQGALTGTGEVKISAREKSKLWIEVARVLVRMGNLDMARRVLAATPPPTTNSFFWSEIAEFKIAVARVLFAMGEIDSAHRMLDEIEPYFYSERVAGEMSVHQRAFLNVQAAMVLAPLGTPRERARAYSLFIEVEPFFQNEVVKKVLDDHYLYRLCAEMIQVAQVNVDLKYFRDAGRMVNLLLNHWGRIGGKVKRYRGGSLARTNLRAWIATILAQIDGKDRADHILRQIEGRVDRGVEKLGVQECIVMARAFAELGVGEKVALYLNAVFGDPLEDWVYLTASFGDEPFAYFREAVRALKTIDPDVALPHRVQQVEEHQRLVRDLLNRLQAETAEREDAEERLVRDQIINQLSSRKRQVRDRALEAYFAKGMQEERAAQPLAKILLSKHEINQQREIIDHLLELRRADLVDQAAQAMAIFEDPRYFERLTRSHKLPRLGARIAEYRAQDELRESLVDKLREVTGTIMDRLAKALKLELPHRATSTLGGAGHYATVSLVPRMRTEVRQLPDLRVGFLDRDFLDVEEGISIDDLQRRLQALNFLVHHAVGHLVLKHKGESVRIPDIDSTSYTTLDIGQHAHEARQIAIDRIAVELGKQIYVYTERGTSLPQKVRERMVIRAYYIAAQIVFEDIRKGHFPQSKETMARMAAVLLELSQSRTIGRRTFEEVKQLAFRFRELMKHRSSGEVENAELDRLVDDYRRIFRETAASLP